MALKTPGFSSKIRIVASRFYTNEVVNGTDGGGKRDLRVGVNGTDGGGKRDLPEIQYKDNEEREIDARAQKSVENQPDIYATLSKSPKAETADQLFSRMQEFYKDFPEQWKVGILDFCKARKFRNDRLGEIMRTWAAYQIKSNQGGNTYKMLHASVQQWFLNQGAFEPKNQDEQQHITIQF